MASGIWHLACQTYALNLIDSHGGQKQAPQLFSSPKSFRVAKSTPSSRSLLAMSSAGSSTASSAKLPPISKWLSKPPLLCKSALFLAPLLLLSYTQDTQALSAQTSRVIEGSAPYLTFDGGQTKAMDTDTLLAIELPDGRVITPSTNTSSRTNPIMLPDGDFTFGDIHTVVPLSVPWSYERYTIGINDLVNQGKWGDDDGDGQGVNGVTASGSIWAEFAEITGEKWGYGFRLTACRDVPYTVTLNSTGGSLTTRYGLPNRSTFSGGRVTYYLMPSRPEICSVRPNLLFGGTTGIDSRDNRRYAGPPSIWNPAKGFLVQSTNPSSYNLNFPTTGADGLYFDLLISGLDASQLRWTVNTSGSIGATVSWTRPRTGRFTLPNGNSWDADYWITDKSKNVTRVTLTGPRASSSQISSSNPSPLARPALPQTFELVGRDSNGHEVRYGFVLKQWFVNRGGEEKYYREQLAWCNSLGYRIPQVSDLTNAKCSSGVNSSFRCIYGIGGATPRSSDNNYERHIGAGFFTEWGEMGDYVDAGFVGTYWTNAVAGSDKFYVYSYNGAVSSIPGTYTRYAVCPTP
ncbi:MULTISPECIES: hypothetical protein [unclassified Gilliamella]|uniref:hypothetical protein n=1 Tax=unclassified Gilliamella TaxID=2685620 RepID=UPI0013294436|nr:MULTISPECIES: hypothetical protein [unclassified Gilliamella]MWN30855.1 hypothetical protein [Gilliamella sp. Pra-s60]MWP28580.1 hypothetical protein [Gilliamella sp. Pra-s54]